MTQDNGPRLTVNLADQVAIVTGAGRGLGRNIAQDLAAQGFWIAGEVDIDNIAFAMRAWKLF